MKQKANELNIDRLNLEEKLRTLKSKFIGQIMRPYFLPVYDFIILPMDLNEHQNYRKAYISSFGENHSISEKFETGNQILAVFDNRKRSLQEESIFTFSYLEDFYVANPLFR